MFDLKKIMLFAIVISSAECHAVASTVAFAQEATPVVAPEAPPPPVAPPPAGTACLIGVHPGIDEADAQTATMLVCHELRKQNVSLGEPVFDAQGAAAAYRVVFHRLGAKILIRLSHEQPLGSIVIDRQLMLGSIEEMTAAAPRLVDALVHRKTMSSTVNVVNVVEQDSPVRRKKTGEFLWNLGLFGTFIPGTDIMAAPGMEIGGFYETESFSVGMNMRFGGANQGDDGFGQFSVSVGGRHFFNKQNLSPYLGGGLAWSTLGFDRETDGLRKEYSTEPGLGAYAVVGIEFLRLYESRMMFELRIDAPLYQLHEDSDSEDIKYIMPVSLGISYAF
jgi:hypothetical protein